jgi:phosphatidylserine/phosphatidylglycerophosphate/cardiolipin synthase-like enzyme
MTAEAEWYLSAEERGNDASDIDRRHEDGKSWTEGNLVQVLIHGAEYFPRLYAELCQLRTGDWVHFTDWRGDPDERLAGPGTEIAQVLADLAGRGVHVRGLVWRSHPDQAHFSEQENLHLVETINEAGGEVLLDERVRRVGSHHQKLFVLRRPGEEAVDRAFVGGIDLCHGRNDDAHHRGDPQAIDIDPKFGPRPPWHDVQAFVRGPVVGDLAQTFRERWEDDTPVDHRSPINVARRKIAREPRHPDPLPPMPDDPPPAGNCSVQVLRTYPAKRPRYPFAPDGERSIARAYRKAFARACRLIYIEDQYLWSDEIVTPLAERLREEPRLKLVIVVPRFPDRAGRFSKPPHLVGHLAAIHHLRDAGGDRVAVSDLTNAEGWPIYVHSKICVVDDVWMTLGSDNLNCRSWTHDSELTIAVLDSRVDDREPIDPGGHGDGARTLARDTRLRLWCEHLGRDPEDVDDLVDPDTAFAAWQDTAARFDRWCEDGRRGDAPPGRIRPHRPDPLRPWQRWWAKPFYRLVVDPDGRPRQLRRRREL